MVYLGLVLAWPTITMIAGEIIHWGENEPRRRSYYGGAILASMAVLSWLVALHP